MFDDFGDKLVNNHHTRPWVLALRRPLSRRRALPSFVIVGAQKAGTTSLYEYLCQHDLIEAAALKETRHFDLEPAAPLSRYRRYFPVLRDERTITGEATPEYFCFPWVPDALKTAVPNARIIAILRDPVERAFSHYGHSLSRGEEHLEFDAAIRAESSRLTGGPGRPSSPAARRYSRFSYAARGRYAEQLTAWFRAFGRDNVLVLMFDDLAADPQAVVDRATDFLGVSRFQLGPVERHNVGAGGKMDSTTRAHLEQYFAPHDAALAELLGETPAWMADRSPALDNQSE